MGDPRKQRRKYDRPTHPWKAERIVQENELCKKYGLKNMSELWRAAATVRRFRQQARELLAASGEERQRQESELLGRLSRMKILDTGKLDDVLALTIEDILERRLQTVVCKRGLANTMKHARQLIVHGHVYVNDRVVNVPRYLVLKDEEEGIRLNEEISKVSEVDEKAG